MGLIEQIHDICTKANGVDLTITANGNCLTICRSWVLENGGRRWKEHILTWKELMLYPDGPEELVERTLAMLEYSSTRG